MIVGVGGIGAFLTYAAVATGARVLVVDLDPARLRACNHLGAFATLQAGEAAIADRLAELGMDAEVFFEVSGSAPGLGVGARGRAARRRHRARRHSEDAAVRALGGWTLREYTIVGTVALVFATDLPEAVRLLGLRDDWTDFTREVIPLEDLVDDGLDPLVAGHSRQIKTLIDPWIDAPRRPVHTP